MTLARTALRLCTVEALKDATIAGKRIYDSRIADLNAEEYAADALPTVLLLSDKDQGEQQSQNNGGPPFWRNVELQFEIGMVKAVKVGNTYEADIPDTDARLEASLDLFEFQLLRRLQYGTDQLPIMFRAIARITKYDSHRQVLDDANPKQAMRLLTLACTLQDDRVRLEPTAGPQPEGYDVFPYPLSAVAKLMPVGSSGKDVVDGLLAVFTKLTVPPFTGMDAEVTGITAAEPSDPEAESNTISVVSNPEQPAP